MRNEKHETRNFLIYSTMKKCLFLILAGIFFYFPSFSQMQIGYPALTKQDIPEAKFSPLRSFNGESLYGYIDGGADLYLEYGFTGVVITEFVWLKGKYKTEIYKMNSPEAAFGIFSVSRFRCRTRPDFSTYTCQNKYQMQICCGQYYISIINESGSSADSIASILIGKKIVEKINEPSIDFNRFFPGIPSETIRNGAVLVKGRLGVINGASDLEGYLKGLGGCTAVILKTPGKTLVSLKFEGNEEYEKFGVSHNWEMDNLSESAHIMPGGETVRKLYDNHLLIEIPETNQP
jgi:hypothetical protein